MKKSYPFKVWFSTLFAAPTYWAISIASDQGSFTDFSEFFLLIIFAAFYGILISSPTFLIYYFACRQMAKMGGEIFWVKLFSAFLAICGVLLTIHIIFQENLNFVFLPYMISILVFSFLYRLRQEVDPEDNLIDGRE